MTEPKVVTVRGRRLMNQLAGVMVAAEGVTLPGTANEPPLFVPKDLVKEITGQDMPKPRPVRHKRADPKKTARRKLAKASRKRNR